MTAFSVRSGLILLSVSLSAMSLAGCYTPPGNDGVIYKSAGSRPPLDVPPDLVSPTSSQRYQIPQPGGATTLSAYQREQRDRAGNASAMTPKFKQVTLERSGQLRWLKVNQPADQVWQQVREFWLDNGFLISEESPEIGVMQTDWAEKTEKISGGLIRDTLSRVFGTRYSTAERDAFRARLESIAGGTEIYISHRGMEEVITESLDENTRWQPRPTNHELEVEFLRRLMTHLGTSEGDATNAVAQKDGQPEQLSELVRSEGGSVLRLREGFDRAWRRIGLALDRGSFTVEDRNRAQGTYFVRYIDSDKVKEKPGVFRSIFGSGDKATAAPQYRIIVSDAGAQTDVSVQAARDAQEAADKETTRRMLAVIQEKLGQ